MVTVRRFEDGDAEEVSRVLSAAFRSFLGDMFDEKMQVYFSPEHLSAGAHHDDAFSVGRTFVAVEDDRIVGAVKVTAGANPAQR